MTWTARIHQICVRRDDVRIAGINRPCFDLRENCLWPSLKLILHSRQRNSLIDRIRRIDERRAKAGAIGLKTTRKTACPLRASISVTAISQDHSLCRLEDWKYCSSDRGTESPPWGSSLDWIKDRNRYPSSKSLSCSMGEATPILCIPWLRWRPWGRVNTFWASRTDSTEAVPGRIYIIGHSHNLSCHQFITLLPDDTCSLYAAWTQ